VAQNKLKKMSNFVDINTRPANRSMYPNYLTEPMAAELTDFGFQGLKTAEEVEAKLSEKSGTTLIMVNSVCGCAAAMARPGAKMSLQNDKKPDNLVTVFAGVDSDAVQTAREFLLPYPPSSPAIALFKDGKLVHILERRHIEGRTAQIISENLKAAYDTYC
jgi:putative YphP/YqiW family bacilliredoxin